MIDIGLDMTLRAEKYISGFAFYGEEQVAQFKATVEAAGMADLVDHQSPSVSVSTVVMYWRKANAIHAWFVDKVQGGVDECQEAEVTRENLVALRAACVRVLDADPYLRAAVAGAAGLSPRPGFFFGSTDMDEWYLRDLTETRDRLSRLLDSNTDGLYFTYQSSW